MKTTQPPRRMLVGATALALLLFLPTPGASAASNVARQEIVPTVTITADATAHNEADGPMGFTLHANPAPATDLEVNLDSQMTGVIFTDVVERSFTETISAGDSTHSFDFTIVNDFIVEPDGEVTISIADGETIYVAGTPSSAETALVDDDAPIAVSWDDSTIHVDENAGTVVVPIFLSVANGEPPGTWKSTTGVHEGNSFIVTTQPVTADPGEDFVYQSPDFAFDIGSFTMDESGNYSLSVDFEFEILDDTEVEPDETLQLEFEHLIAEPLQNDGTVLPTQPKTVVITDNDGDPPEPPDRPWPPPDYCPTHPDTPANTSTPLTVEVGGSTEGDFCGKDDADWVRVNLRAGQAYRIEGTYTPPRGEGHIYIGAMRDPDGGLITGSHSFDGNPDGTSNTPGYINFRPTESGAYYIVAGDMNWWDFQYATGPLPWRIEVNEIDLPPDDVPDIHHLTLEFNNYGQLVASVDGTINTHGDRDTFAVDVVVGHQYFVEMRTRSGSGIFNCIHRITPEAAPEDSTGGAWFGCQHQPGWKAYLWFTARHEGRYLVTVGSENGTGDYELRIKDTDAVPPRHLDNPSP